MFFRMDNYSILCFFFLAADLNHCLNVHCPRFGVCRTYSAHDARCECDDQCPSYKDPVCTANGTTYDNRCWHKLSYCRGLENNLVYHPGSCEGNEKWFQQFFGLCMPHKIVWELSSRSLRIRITQVCSGKIWCKKVQKRRKSKTRVVNITFKYQFTWSCIYLRANAVFIIFAIDFILFCTFFAPY